MSFLQPYRSPIWYGFHAGAKAIRHSLNLASKKIFFRPFAPQFGLNIMGDPGPPYPSPGSAKDEALLTRRQLLSALDSWLDAPAR